MATTATTTLRAFHGDAALKAALLVEIGKHEEADAIVKGSYGDAGLSLADGFRGCAVGCALHSLNRLRGSRGSVGDHARFPAELGIPIELAYLIDNVFENLPDTESQTWPRRVIEAIPVGADLDSIVGDLLQWMIADSTNGLIALAKPEFHDAYRQFAALVDRDWHQSGSVALAEWDAIDNALAHCEIWAGAGAWARAWAGAWARARARARAWAWAWARARARARAGARAWARAGARAWARAGAKEYSRLSTETLRRLHAAGDPPSAQDAK